MTLIGISCIILATVFSVHFVHEHAHKKGLEHGIAVGREQILKENILREKHRHNNFDSDLAAAVEMLSNDSASNSQIKDMSLN